ncbi:hypothetical protein ACTPEF_25090, partial [Clostridioides difficile]
HPSTIISNIKNIRIPAMRELEESGGSFGSIEDMIDGLFEKDGQEDRIYWHLQELQTFHKQGLL